MNPQMMEMAMKAMVSTYTRRHKAGSELLLYSTTLQLHQQQPPLSNCFSNSGPSSPLTTPLICFACYCSKRCLQNR